MLAVADNYKQFGLELIRPLSYRKTLTMVARLENDQIRDDIETAIDYLRDARSKVMR